MATIAPIKKLRPTNPSSTYSFHVSISESSQPSVSSLISITSLLALVVVRSIYIDRLRQHILSCVSVYIEHVHNTPNFSIFRIDCVDS